ncbi:MAG TPA: alpha-L-fucosidase [Fimbriimonas sp.]|nr:alpha-L-fucosidase [Fimbriimonas sp.]
MLPLLLTLVMADIKPLPPLPSERQLAWHQMEQYAFVHFGPNTFTDKEWGEGKEDPKLFNPTELDCRQWARVARAAGLTGIIITAKHHDGFCLWPSKYSTHTVAASPYRGDVLKELSAACKAEGLKMGVYLSPWDRNHPTYGTPEYNQVFANMLTEVLTQYGSIFEVWFDGANGEGPNGKKQVYDWKLFIDTVRKHQPGAVIFSDAGPDIRWVGNEDGHSAPECWATIDRDRYVPGTPLYKELTTGKKGGKDWVPAECDVSIRPGWFYHVEQDSHVKTPEYLLKLWEESVGQNANFLLNVPPDRRGLWHAADVNALLGWKRLRDRIYGKPLFAAKGSEVRFGKPLTFDRVELREPIEKGQRVAKFRLEALVDGRWHVISEQTTIGRRRIVRVPRTTAEGMRAVVLESLAEPIISDLRVYNSER